MLRDLAPESIVLLSGEREYCGFQRDAGVGLRLSPSFLVGGSLLAADCHACRNATDLDGFWLQNGGLPGNLERSVRRKTCAGDPPTNQGNHTVVRCFPSTTVDPRGLGLDHGRTDSQRSDRILIAGRIQKRPSTTGSLREATR